MAHHHDIPTSNQTSPDVLNHLEVIANAPTPNELAKSIIRGLQQPEVYEGIDFIMATEVAEASMAGWDAAEQNGRLTDEYMSVRKQVVLGIVQELRNIRDGEADPSKPETTLIANRLKQELFSSDPNIASYVGYIEDDLEVLGVLATLPELRQPYFAKCHVASYDLAFDPNSGEVVDGLLDGKTPVEQLRALRVLSDITSVMQYEAGYESAELGARRIAERLWEYVEDDKITAWMPNSVALSMVNRIHLGEAPSDSIEGIAPEVIEEEREFAADKSFDGDWAKLQPMQLAPGLIGARNRYGIIEGASSYAPSENGKITGCNTLKLILEQQGITASNEEMELFQELRNPGLQGYLEWQLGNVWLQDMPLATQFRLVNFAGTRSVDDFGRLVDTVRNSSPESRKLLMEAFLATEFGDDFGNTLLTLAEHLPSEQLGLLLEKVQTFRDYGARFANQFEGFDDTIVGEVQRAIAERVTETLYVAQALAQSNDEPVTGKVLGNRITIHSMDEVMHALDLMSKGLERIDESNRGSVTTDTYDEDNRSAWHLGTESDVLLQVKPYGEQRGEYVKGLEHSEEAQINWSVDVLTDSGDYVPTRIADYRRRYALSIRIDLEGIIRDANGGKVGFDATREQLAAALDIGSLRGAEDNPNVQVARVISLGNKLRKAALGRGRSVGYHTSLAPKYGHKETFAQLAEFIRGKHRDRLLGRVAVAGLLDQSLAPSSVSPVEKAAA